MEQDREIGKKIEQLMFENGLNQEALAKKMEISQGHLSHLINGNKSLSKKIAFKLEDIFDISFEVPSSKESLSNTVEEKEYLQKLENVYKELIASKDALIANQKELIDEKEEKIHHLKNKIQALEAEIRGLKN